MSMYQINCMQDKNYVLWKYDKSRVPGNKFKLRYENICRYYQPRCSNEVNYFKYDY